MKVIVTYILSFLFLLSLLGGLNSCREEIDMDDRDTLEVLPVELINTNISGQVKDLEGKIINGANVLISTKEMLTDQNGYFSFSNIKADRNGTVITVEKEGYLENKITVYPSLNHDLFSSITLIKDNSASTMLSWQGGEVVLGEMGSLYIPPNTLVYASDGSNFEGTAQIHFYPYDMADPLLEHIIPGDLTAYASSNVKKGLIPASILRISLSDGKLNDLRLATGQTAELNLVPSDHFLDEWPEELSMFRFNDENNQWIKTGRALSLESNLYTAQVNDLGFICLGKDYDIVQLEGSIHYGGNNSTARHHIDIISDIQKPAIQFQTDEQGHFKGFVPASTPLNLEISNECGFGVYEENIEELVEDTDFEKELQVSTDCRNLPIQGRLLDCDGAPVANGYVRITSEENDLFVTTDAEGYYAGEFKLCNKDLTIDLTAYNRDQELGTTVHKGFPVENAIQIADWKICDSAGDIGLQFRDGFYFLTDDIQFKISTGSLLLQGFSTFLEIDFAIWDFRGVDVYTIPNENSGEFIVTFSPKEDEIPKLVPKDKLSLWTYKLIVDHYIENEYIEGSVVGLARDDNHNNEEGMFFMKFSAPFVAK